MKKVVFICSVLSITSSYHASAALDNSVLVTPPNVPVNLQRPTTEDVLSQASGTTSPVEQPATTVTTNPTTVPNLSTDASGNPSNNQGTISGTLTVTTPQTTTPTVLTVEGTLNPDSGNANPVVNTDQTVPNLNQ